MKQILNTLKAMFSFFFQQTGSGEMPKALNDKLSFLISYFFEIGIRGKLVLKSIEQGWNSHVKSFASPVIKSYRHKIALSQTGLKTIRAKLLEPLEDIVHRYAAYLKPALDKATMVIIKRYDEMELLKKYKENERIQAYVNLEAIKAGLKTIPAIATFLDGILALIVTFLIISIGETFLSISSIDALGIPWTLLSGVICFLFSSLIGVGCHFFGAALSHKNYLHAIISFFSALAMTVFIIALRYQVTEPEDNQYQHELLALANFITLGFGLLMAERVNRYRPYFKAKALITVLTKEIDGLTKMLTLKDCEIENTKGEYISIALQQAYGYVDDLQVEDQRLEEILATNQSDLNAYLNTIECWEKQGIAALNASYLNGQNQQPFL